MYVKIINKGECFSTTLEFIDGVYANKDEWAKHNFYPKNDMVGEVVKRTPSAYIVKVMNGIYVPMSPKGIREITYEEYQAGKCNNVCDGMDAQQQNLNELFDSFSGGGWRRLPDMRSVFAMDILKNMEKLTCDFKRTPPFYEVEDSAVMYAVDMCLEYRSKSGGKLDIDILRGITDQVTDVYVNFFPRDFTQKNKANCVDRVTDLMNNPHNARTTVDDYYYRINVRYSQYF